MSDQQITAQNFIRLGIAAFKEHELREIVAIFCKLPGIAPQHAPADATEEAEIWDNAYNYFKAEAARAAAVTRPLRAITENKGES